MSSPRLPPRLPTPAPCCAGAAFGKGIYFSSELPVAFAFCQPADGWGGSALGPRLRCLLVCSIQREHAQGAHNSSEVGGVGGGGGRGTQRAAEGL